MATRSIWRGSPPTRRSARASPSSPSEILGKIDGFLKQGGTDKTKLLQATIWLQDIRTVDEFNKVWDAWVVAGQTPARACIEARLQSPGQEDRDPGDRGAVSGGQPRLL